MTYPNIRQAQIKQNLDRGTWVEPLQVIVSYEVSGSGELVAGPLDFHGVVFDKAPLFTYGVELISPALVTGKFPFVNCGVSQWVTTVAQGGAIFYTGAHVWIKVVTQMEHRLKFQLAFEGASFKNTSLIR